MSLPDGPNNDGPELAIALAVGITFVLFAVVILVAFIVYMAYTLHGVEGPMILFIIVGLFVSVAISIHKRLQ